MHTREEYEQINKEIKATVSNAILAKDEKEHLECVQKANSLREKLGNMHSEDEQERNDLILELKEKVKELDTRISVLENKQK